MLKSALVRAEGIEVIATAQNGDEGLKKILQLKPDVVTLDIEMPGMDGLQVLQRVMKERPLPVVMVSTKTQQGAQVTLEALSLGAVDYVAKPVGAKGATLADFKESIVNAVRAAAQSNHRRIGRPVSTVGTAIVQPAGPRGMVIAIGISAGGPATLHGMIPVFGDQTPPIIITQHMPAEFTGPFAKRLDAAARVDVKQAENGDALRPGLVLIAPGSHHLRLVKGAGGLKVALDSGAKVSGFRLSVDVMFDSVAVAAGPLAIGVIMTGMGHDGSDGVRQIKRRGGTTIAQDEVTSIVYGMPEAAFQTGCVDRVEPLERIPLAIAEAVEELAGVGMP